MGQGFSTAVRQGFSRSPALPLVFAVFLLIAVGIQLASGAYSAAFDGHPDEASHVVSSLLYRQFLLHPTTDPLGFAKQYYAHYPYLGAGHWPPGLHSVGAVWTILFGAGRLQLMLLLATAAALTATFLYRSIRNFSGLALAVVFASLFLLLSESQAALTRFMTEGPVALFTFSAVVSYVRYLRSPSYGAAALFGLLASAALLTRETALALAVVPPLAVLLTRRWSLLRQGHFWLPAATVIGLLAPWHVWVGSTAASRFHGGPLQRILAVTNESSVWSRVVQFGYLLGWPIFLLALVGLVAAVLIKIADKKNALPYVAHGSLLAGGAVFHVLVPESKEVRHLYQLAPSLLFFAAFGTWSLTRRLPHAMQSPAAALLGLSCVFVSTFGLTLPRKDAPRSLAIAQAARLLGDDDAARLILVDSSASVREGALIAGLALLEPEPERYVLRASKTLYNVSWDAQLYTPYAVSESELRQFLDESHVDRIVWIRKQEDTPRPDEDSLAAVVAQPGSNWSLQSDQDGVSIYRRYTLSTLPPQPIRIRTSHRLGEDLLIEPQAGLVQTH